MLKELFAFTARTGFQLEKEKALCLGRGARNTLLSVWPLLPARTAPSLRSRSSGQRSSESQTWRAGDTALRGPAPGGGALHKPVSETPPPLPRQHLGKGMLDMEVATHPTGPGPCCGPGCIRDQWLVRPGRSLRRQSPCSACPLLPARMGWVLRLGLQLAWVESHARGLANLTHRMESLSPKAPTHPEPRTVDCIWVFAR